MTKGVLFAILLAVFSLLAACSLPGTADPTPPPTVTTSAATAESSAATNAPTTEEPTQPILSQGPLITVSLPVTTETFKAEDGTVLFTYTFQHISLITQDPDIADLVIIDFLNRIDATRLTADRICSMAQNAYAGQNNWSAYMSMVSFDPRRIDGGVLSLFGTQAGFYGSTHPETVYSAITYDLVTGLPLTLGDILPDSSSVESLRDLTLEVLRSQEKSLQLFDDYADTVNAHFSSGTVQHDWYFTDRGLVFFFVPYEIAPYSMGVVAAEIPYDRLAGILHDGYFPAERDTASGELLTQCFDPDSLNSFSRFTELVQDSTSGQYLLYTDQTIRSLRIESGVWSATGSFYTPQHTVFAASALYSGDALMLQADLSGEYPPLRISWETDSGLVTRFLTLDESGNPQLIMP